jgi:hypothetical protein
MAEANIQQHMAKVENIIAFMQWIHPWQCLNSTSILGLKNFSFHQHPEQKNKASCR